jgi:hypothetical protein
MDPVVLDGGLAEVAFAPQVVQVALQHRWVRGVRGLRLGEQRMLRQILDE